MDDANGLGDSERDCRAACSRALSSTTNLFTSRSRLLVLFESAISCVPRLWCSGAVTSDGSLGCGVSAEPNLSAAADESRWHVSISLGARPRAFHVWYIASAWSDICLAMAAMSSSGSGAMLPPAAARWFAVVVIARRTRPCTVQPKTTMTAVIRFFGSRRDRRRVGRGHSWNSGGDDGPQWRWLRSVMMTVYLDLQPHIGYDTSPETEFEITVRLL